MTSTAQPAALSAGEMLFADRSIAAHAGRPGALLGILERTPSRKAINSSARHYAMGLDSSSTVASATSFKPRIGSAAARTLFRSARDFSSAGTSDRALTTCHE